MEVHMNRNNETLKITTGAMIIAIFAMLLLLNRQTGAFFEEMFIYILPIPMVVYATKYSWKYGLMVFAGMTLFSFIFGSVTTVFYAITGALLGLILGTCFYYKVNMTTTMLLSMGLAALFNVLSTITLASVFGYDLNREIDEMQNMMNQVFTQAKVETSAATSQMLEAGFLKQMMIISMVLMGLVQGFIIYQLSVIILKKLRFSIGAPTSFSSIYPPKWTGFAAIAAYSYGATSFFQAAENSVRQDIGQTLWVVGYVWLLCFGLIAVNLAIRKYIVSNKLIAAVITFMSIFILPQLVMILGMLYISFGFHDKLLQPR